MSENTLHALFGGTFDPIHYGHLKPVEILAEQVGLKKVTLLPNNVPPHRPQPEASPAQRIEMVRRAIAGNPLFDLDLREMARQTPSYTIETLAALREARGQAQPLAFIIGYDSLLSLPKWHRWQDLLSFAHLLVSKRPGYDREMATPLLQDWLHQHQVYTPQALHESAAGKVFLAETPLLPISATEIRQRLHCGAACDTLLPAAVLAFINDEGLYRKPKPHGILRR
ncbi:nicotinate-nucleotide adenylyltransferase [Pantoea sp. FN060301]|uniref:nicotinate-nucleotide adenylyltransferase n=1 Tax=Pantoea sp. FN060301 TaxID=3420380 RepID=UPI003D1866D2